jgi:hypothetical protein
MLSRSVSLEVTAEAAGADAEDCAVFQAQLTKGLHSEDNRRSNAPLNRGAPERFTSSKHEARRTDFLQPARRAPLNPARKRLLPFPTAVARVFAL